MSDTEKIKVVMVDDHPVVLEGLRALLMDNESLQILDGFTTGNAVLEFMDKQEVDVVLLDISLPDINGTSLCQTMKEKFPETRVLAISNHDERSIVTAMLQNGASGYLLKNASAEELAQCIQSAIEGNLAFSEEVQKILAKGTSGHKPLPKLTRREKEVLKWVAEGMTTSAIAEKLYISPLTVETHRRNVMQKLEVNNTASLIKKAMEFEII